MSRINRLAVGLQDFLGSKNFGDNPSELAQSVLPSLELFKFYATERVTHFRGTAAFSARGQSSTQLVPLGEIWLPLSVHYGIPGATNGGFGFSLSFEMTDYPSDQVIPAGNPYVFATSGAQTTGAVGDGIFFTHEWDNIIAVQSDTAFRLRSIAWGVGTETVEWNLRYVRLRV